MRTCSNLPTCSEPWNIMCSKRWAKPVRSFGSIRKPMRYMTSTMTVGDAWFSLTTTRRPFGSFRYTMGTEKVADVLCAGDTAVARVTRQAERSILRDIFDWCDWCDGCDGLSWFDWDN